MAALATDPRYKLRTAANLELICRRLSVGEALCKILDTEGMPSLAEFWRWMNADEEARGDYARARAEQGHWYADRVAELALAEPVRGEHGIDPGEVAHRRLAIDSMKWLAAKRTPKAYGDQVAQTTIQVGVQVGVLTDERRMELIRKKRLANA